jgi:DNA-binding MarR family transcriptional regulator
VIPRQPGATLLALQRATHTTLHLLATRLADLELSPAEANTLANLAADDGSPISRLALAAGVRPSTLTSQLDRLERRGLLTRSPHPADRRSVTLSLTDRGRLAGDRVLRAFADLEEAALAGLDPATREALHRGLAALAEVAP